MKTLFAQTISILLLSTLAFAAPTAEPTQTTTEKAAAAAPPAAPLWKANFNSYNYDFTGTAASKEADYGFDHAALYLQLLTLQYHLNPSWTLQVMAQATDNYVETVFFPRAGTPIVYRDRTKGLGDTFVSAITPLAAAADGLLLVDFGVSLPTGDINQSNKNVATPDKHLAYNMQNGSGTVDTVVGVTGLSFQGPVQLGSRIGGTFRNGRNANGYTLGNQYRADVWADYQTALGLTPRLVGYYKHKEAVSGADDKYVDRSQAFDRAYSEFYYHRQINWDLSAALKYTHNFGAVGLGLEAGVPVAQGSENYDAAVVSTNYYGNVSLSGSF